MGSKFDEAKCSTNAIKFVLCSINNPWNKATKYWPSSHFHECQDILCFSLEKALWESSPKTIVKPRSNNGIRLIWKYIVSSLSRSHYSIRAISCMNKVAIILLQWLSSVSQCVTINVSSPAPYVHHKQKTPYMLITNKKLHMLITNKKLPITNYNLLPQIKCPMYKRHWVGSDADSINDSMCQLGNIGD